MPEGLQRVQASGELHFVTFSCYERKPYLRDPAARDTFESSLEGMSQRYGCAVIGYVVMPEHVHLLLSEPPAIVLGRALQAIKLSVANQRPQRPFWYPRYYDFNVYTTRKINEKLQYMHWNPVKRGLVAEPGEWAWSSWGYYATGAKGKVPIETR